MRTMTIKRAIQTDTIEGVLTLARNLLVACDRLDAFGNIRPGGDVLVQLPHFREVQRAADALREAMK